MPRFQTADASERLAKKQTAKQLGVGAAVDKGLTVKFDNRNVIAKGYDAVRSVPMARLSTPVNTGGGVSMGGIANPIESNVEPVRQAGRRAVGDITAIPGVGKPSASPTARDFREGNYVAPIVDYATLASTVIPAAAKGVSAVRNRPVYGIHSSPAADLDVIQPRALGQPQRTAGDAVAGSSYMWDARSPYVNSGDVLLNPQMNLANLQFLDEMPNNLYLTRAPRRSVIADANIPNAPSLRVQGPQQVVANLPIERDALIAALRSYGVTPRSNMMQNIVSQLRTNSPAFRRSATQRIDDMARERAAVAARQADGPKVELPAGRKTAKELNRERRATEIVDEYGVDLDEAVIMAEVEDDFRAALVRDADRIASPETRQQFIQWAKSTPIEQIRAQNPDFDKMFEFMAEMGGIS